MSASMFKRTATAALIVGVLPLALAACGGGDSSTSGSTGETEATGSETTKSETGGSGGADIAAAKKVIAPYIGKPSPFPVTEKLKEVPTGAKIAYMNCGAPVCAIFYEGMSAAAKTMGVEVVNIKAGTAANTVASAFDTAVTGDFQAVVVTAIPIELWSKQLKELQANEVPVITTGVTGTEPYGVESPQVAEPMDAFMGELMANYAIAEFSPSTNYVYYNVPELPFSDLIEEKVKEVLSENCPECTLRTAKVPAAQLGNTAPNTVVSDLQANPDTEVAILSTEEIGIGLAPALRTAGIEVKTIGQTPTPPNLEALKKGEQTSALGVDIAVLSWTLLDQAAREIIGQPLSGSEAEGISVVQFLTPEDITFDPAKGWTGYPEFPEKFAGLWGVKG
jgi:ribose transport system substrate-binding protein